MRQRLIVISVILALSPIVIPGSSTSGASLNPCALAPASAVASALGVAHAPTGDLLPVDTANGVGNYVCDYIHGKVQLEPQIALLKYGQLSPDGGTGSTLTHPSGLGPHGVEVVVPSDPYTSVLFVKDGYRIAVNALGPISSAHVLALARVIYRRFT